MLPDMFFQVGDRIRVSTQGPFKGLKGTVLRVDSIVYPIDEKPFLFYQVELEGTHIHEPIWFQYDEVEPVNSGEYV